MKRRTSWILCATCLASLIVLALGLVQPGCGPASETALWLRIMTEGDFTIDEVEILIFPTGSTELLYGPETVQIDAQRGEVWVLIYADDPDMRIDIEGTGMRIGRVVANGRVEDVGFTAGQIKDCDKILVLKPEGERDEDGDGFFVPYDCDDHNPDVHPEATEACGDDMDNNCDGAIDEGCGCSPEGGARDCWPHWAPEPAAGSPCHQGTQTCTSGTWSACEGIVLPVPERCPDHATDCYRCLDGVDNDCDGYVDDRDPGANPASKDDPENEFDRGCGGCFPGEFTPCYNGTPGTAGIGLCREGLAECVDGAPGDCVGEVVPTTDPESGQDSEYDLCDGFDNDCDGVTDDVEAYPACERPEGRLCGVCSGLFKKCQNGAWRNCEDNDYRDNAVAMLCGGADEPDCCTAGDLDCYVADENDTRLCDSWDNDCDCAFDEVDADDNGVPDCTCENGAQKPCPEGLPDPNRGECNAGYYNCIGGSWEIDGSCIEPVAERCDCRDNDCDGVTDGQGARDGCPASQDHATWRTCVMGVCVFDCEPGYVDLNHDLGEFGSDGCEYGCTQTDPAIERCDGVDNECDGKTDAEQLEGLSGQERTNAINALCPPR
ncbi:MAG: putative metal-binding motif-containing protein, partial [Deltaproteobacteria bacterium]|nr:putative metal-binding motif-containing protein [Deltaproteobacteria bacterium]